MGKELINRITKKKDGIYVSTHSSNDDAPYHSVKIDSLTNIYKQEGQKGLDREIISMLFNYTELRGSHHSLQRYLYAYNSKYAEKWYKKYTDKMNYYYEKLDDIDKKSLWSCNKTENARNYHLQKSALEKEMYNKIAEKCDEYDLINSIMSDNQNNEQFLYYDNIINKILDISDEYNIDFDNSCPFSSFGSDDESRYLEMYSFSEFYKEILEKNNIKIDDISTSEKSDGKYIITIDNNYEFEVNAWEKLNNVFDNVESMINIKKEKEVVLEYDR